MSWQNDEKFAAKWFIENYDSEAIYMGKSDCNAPDILSPKYGIIEIKGPAAQGGQFTESKIHDDPMNKYIANKAREDVTEEDAFNWCKHFYEKKNVKYFITYDNKNNYILMTLDEYFNTHTFKLENRITKKSGSRPLSKIYYKYIPTEWNHQIINNKPYVLDKKLWDTHFIFTGRNGTNYIMCPTHDSNGEIRILSNTDNTTWIFKINKK